MPVYSDAVLDHFSNPRNAGELINADGFGSDGTPGHGPAMQFWIKLNGTVLEQVTFKAYGCGAAIACCSILTEMATGLNIDKAMGITPDIVTSSLGGLPLGKYHCPKMAVHAFVHAVKNAINRGNHNKLEI